MKKIFNILKGMLFLLLGIILMLVPYSRFKELFPEAPTPFIIKILGAVIVLCGIIILAITFVYKS